MFSMNDYILILRMTRAFIIMPNPFASSQSTTKIQKLTDLWPLTLQKQNGRGRLNF